MTNIKGNRDAFICIRKANDMTQGTVAKELGYASRKVISLKETGQRPVRAVDVLALAYVTATPLLKHGDIWVIGRKGISYAG